MSQNSIQSGFAEVNGAKLYYETAGEGYPLVFAHAGIADCRMWDDQFAFFAPRYRVLRFDFRGYGKSEPVDGEFAHRDDLVALMQHLGMAKAHLVGCSMGGGCCMEAALQHPGMAASLTMVCSGPPGLELDVSDPETDARFERAEAAWKANDLELTNEIEAQIWFDGRGRTPEQVNPILRRKMLDMNHIALSNERLGRGTRRLPLSPPAAERLNELKLPVLVTAGAQDTAYIRAAADHMEKHIAGARKVIIENSAHLPSMERAGELNQILSDFLTNI